MRTPAALLTFAAVAVLGALLWRGLGDDPAIELPPPAAGPGDAGAAPGAAAGAVELPAGTVAQRASVAAAAAEAGLADRPTACLLVVDHATGQPLAGAAVRRARGGGDLGFSDDRGLVPLPLAQPEQLAIAFAGYLLRLAPTQPGSSESAPQRVALLRDQWSFPVRVRCTGAPAEALGEVFVRCVATDQAATGAGLRPLPIASADPVVTRAWSEHTMLVGGPVFADLAEADFRAGPARAHRLVGDGPLRFVASGAFRLEVATLGGFVGRAEVRIPADGGAGTTVDVPLQRGVVAAGTVRSATGPGVQGAAVEVAGGDPLLLRADTAADGAFRLGPLWPGPLRLQVRHGDYQPVEFGPVDAAQQDLLVLLQPWPRTALRGRVRDRVARRALGNATVQWQPAGANPVTAVTDTDGAFVLQATGAVAARLQVSCAGYLPYAELVDPGAPAADYELLPAVTADRLAAGLTALLSGSVRDASGQPLAGIAVRWHPAQRAAAAGLPGRRVLEGGALDLPLVATTGPDGAFALETQHFGAGRLAFADAAADAPGSLPAEARAGQTTTGLLLQR